MAFMQLVKGSCNTYLREHGIPSSVKKSRNEGEQHHADRKGHEHEKLVPLLLHHLPVLDLTVVAAEFQVWEYGLVAVPAMLML